MGEGIEIGIGIGGAPDGAAGIAIGEPRFSKLAYHRLRGKGDHVVVEGGGCEYSRSLLLFMHTEYTRPYKTFIL